MDPSTGKPYEGDTPEKPGVGIQLRFVPPTEYRRILQEHTAREWEPTAKLFFEKTDNAAVGDHICEEAVIGWYGIEDAHGDPLPYKREYVLYVLDLTMRAEIQYRATRSLSAVEVAEQDASFRQPAGVRDMVAGMAEDDALLPAGDAGRITN